MLEVVLEVVSSDLSENKLVSFINHLFKDVKNIPCVDAAGRSSHLPALVLFVGMISHAALTLTHPPLHFC